MGSFVLEGQNAGGVLVALLCRLANGGPMGSEECVDIKVGQERNYGNNFINSII